MAKYNRRQQFLILKVSDVFRKAIQQANKNDPENAKIPPKQGIDIFEINGVYDYAPVETMYSLTCINDPQVTYGITGTEQDLDLYFMEIED